MISTHIVNVIEEVDTMVLCNHVYAYTCEASYPNGWLFYNVLYVYVFNYSSGALVACTTYIHTCMIKGCRCIELYCSIVTFFSLKG